MKIHEYQARDLLREAGIPVPPGIVITSPDQAAEAHRGVVEQAGAGEGGLAVVKAQVFAGGRGKAGFVKLVRSAKEAGQAAAFMLGNRMVSPQTGPEGIEVKKVLIAAGVEIAQRKDPTRSVGVPDPTRSVGVPDPMRSVGVPKGREEYYLAITTDRATRRNVLIASREGGVEIEQVAHDRPEAIIKQTLHPTLGLQPFAARKVAYALGFKGKQVGQAAGIMSALARLFIEKDCTIAEINPLVLTPPDAKHPDGRVIAIDAKFNFDDNGLFRHADLEAMHDPSEDNPAEIRAKAHGLSYIALDGNIGCLVNGAGLAMATMDIIQLHGGKGGAPANFLDVGGGATEEAVTEAFGIILSDPKVKGIMVNIFGGIMRCDVIAQGIINAARGFTNADGSRGFKVPLVVRLEGTNVEAGRRLLTEARKDIPTMSAATDLADAAKKVCAAVG